MTEAQGRLGLALEILESLSDEGVLVLFRELQKPGLPPVIEAGCIHR